MSIYRLTLNTLLVTFLHIVYGRFPIAIDEKEGDLVLKKDVTSLCDTMRSLEKTLTQLSKDPPMKGGEELMKQLRTYNQACFHLLVLCKSDANEKSKAFKVGNDLFERGGPEFVDEAVNEQVIMQKFQWDKTTLEEMLHARKKTNALWFDLWRLYNNVDISG